MPGQPEAAVPQAPKAETSNQAGAMPNQVGETPDQSIATPEQPAKAMPSHPKEATPNQPDAAMLDQSSAVAPDQAEAALAMKPTDHTTGSDQFVAATQSSLSSNSVVVNLMSRRP